MSDASDSSDADDGGVFFEAPDRAYTVRDVLLAADLRGELGGLRESVRQGIACVRYAEEEGFEVSDEDLQQAADSLRYELDLETEEATEAWFERNGVSAEDFTDHLMRRLLRDRLQDRLAHVAAQVHVLAREAEPLLRVEALLGGDLARLALALARRAAVRAGYAARGDRPNASLLDARRDVFLGERGLGTEAKWGEWMAEHGVHPELFEHLLDLETLYRTRISGLLTADRLRRETQVRVADCVRMCLEGAAFPSASAAREAIVCVREDGDPLEDVARRCGARMHRSRAFLPDHNRVPRAQLLSARVGDLLGPFADSETEHWVYRVCEKENASPEEPEVLERMKAGLVDGLVAGDLDEHIRWVMPRPGG